MIFTHNVTIDVKRFERLDGESNYSTIISALPAYIEPINEEIGITYEWQGAYEVFRLISSNTSIETGDLIIEGSTTYKVLGKRVFNSLVGSHLEAVIQANYDD